MSEQATFSLGEAAKAVGKSKGTISKAISSGRLSPLGREGGQYQIPASELFRVFPPTGRENTEIERMETIKETPETLVLKAQLEAAETRIADKETVIVDLRQRLDQSEQERRDKDRQLTALLTDQRQKPAAEPEKPAPRGFRGFLQRLTG
jgi:hypothetical protein